MKALIKVECCEMESDIAQIMLQYTYDRHIARWSVLITTVRDRTPPRMPTCKLNVDWTFHVDERRFIGPNVQD